MEFIYAGILMLLILQFLKNSNRLSNSTLCLSLFLYLFLASALKSTNLTGDLINYSQAFKKAHNETYAAFFQHWIDGSLKDPIFYAFAKLVSSVGVNIWGWFAVIAMIFAGSVSYIIQTYPLSIKYTSDFEIKLQALKSRIFGNYGFNSRRITKRLIRHLEQINPDIIHLHNLHGHNCHLGMLCDWIRHHQKKAVFPQHDCWAFTAYCPHFTLCKCDKWKACCSNCPQYKNASWFIDRSRELYERKKAAFDGLDLTVVTPPQWLADLTKSSFLGKFPIKVINNGIDLSVFKPTDSDFRERYMLKGKTILLGVAHQWSYRKGLDVFFDLSKILDSHYQIVLVGTDAKIRSELPANIIAIDRTNSCKELAKLYTAADYFINPTREENFPTVNIESLACSTPVITFNTGGSPEIIDADTGHVTKREVASSILDILKMCTNPIQGKACMTRASNFDMQIKFVEYLHCYQQIIFS